MRNYVNKKVEKIKTFLYNEIIINKNVFMQDL